MTRPILRINMIKYQIEIDRAKRNLTRTCEDIIANYERKLAILVKQRDVDLTTANREYESVLNKVIDKQKASIGNANNKAERERLKREGETLYAMRCQVKREELERKLQAERDAKIANNGLHKFNDYRDIMK